MSKTVVEHGNDLIPPEESGGIVTTVKANESKDLDFQARLRQMRIDNGEDPDKVDEPKPDDEVKPKTGEPAVAATASSDGDDWQKDLTPAQRKEVNEIYKERKRTGKELKTANARLAQLEAEVTQLKAGGQQPAKTAAAMTELKKPTRPNPLKFDGTPEQFAQLEEDYEDKLIAYHKEKDRLETEAKSRKEAEKATVERFNASVEKFAESTPDYGDVMDEADNEVSDLMFGAIVEEGPQLGYYFATHPDESAKVARMNERDAVKAIMRIVIKLEDKVVAPKEKKEEKPAPASQVPAKASVATQVDKNKSPSLKEKERAAFKAGKISYDPG